MNKYTLLLGATALLSTIAFNANATHSLNAAEVDVKVEFLTPGLLDVVDTVDFGRIMIDPRRAADDQTITIDADGTYRGTTEDRVLDNGQAGKVCSTKADQLAIETDTVELISYEGGASDPEDPYITYYPQISDAPVTDTVHGYCWTVFGSLNYGNSDSFSGEYNGTLLLTQIYEDQ